MRRRRYFSRRGAADGRGVSVYEELLESRGVTFVHEKDSMTVKGRLQPGVYRMRGDVSSQFISGLLFALPLLEENSVIEILPPFESKGYVDMTLEALETFGIRIVREEARSIYRAPADKATVPHVSQWKETGRRPHSSMG